MVRQTLNALPLVFFIRGLSVYRAVVNDLASHLLAVVAPPPGDVVLRIGMFTSWGLDASKAAAGSMMNMIAFYMMRFSIPVIGVVILLPVRFDSGYAVAAVLGAEAAAAIAVVVVVGRRSEAFARRLGHLAGTLVSKVRRSVQPARWVDATVQFRLDMLDTCTSGFPRSAFALIGLVFADRRPDHPRGRVHGAVAVEPAAAPAGGDPGIGLRVGRPGYGERHEIGSRGLRLVRCTPDRRRCGGRCAGGAAQR